MLETIFLVLLITGVILIVLMVEWESMVLGGIGIAIWFILALSIHQIIIPYQYIDPNTDLLVEGTQSIESMFPLSILFYGIAIIIMLYLIVHLILPMLKGKIKAKKML